LQHINFYQGIFMLKTTKINLVIASMFSVSVLAADLTTNKIEVISTSPLPGLGIEIDKVPSNVQSIKGSDLSRTQSLDLTDYMNRNLTGVYVNEVQNNPVMPDVNYRGFTASPLLGTPQGISVYVDGVRMNQPFGDQISWDLIPKNAIKGMQLMPGSNPSFGLNTLGGALSIQTKDGRNSPGGAMQVSAGSYARKIGEFEYGGVSKDNSLDYFFAGTVFDENGWRDESQSRYGQLFGKLGWKGEKTDLKLTYAYANTDLNGNGLVPLSQNKADYNAIFTSPDNTQNKSHLLNLQLAHYFNDKVNFTGNTYYRHIKTKTLNGDLNESMPEMPGGIGQTLGKTFYNGSTTTTNLLGGTRYKYDCEVAGLLFSTGSDTTAEPNEKCPGAINRTKAIQDTVGMFGQINVDNKIFNMDNKYFIGGGAEFTNTRFTSSREYADIINRRAVGYGFYATGQISSDPDPDTGHSETDDDRVNLRGLNTTWSAFASDTLYLTDKLTLTGSARYNHVTIKNKDKINSSTDDNYIGGTHHFSRINPAVGLTFAANDSLTLYGGYNEGSRAPTSVELSCANPEVPCRLPNAMASDPALKQVVTKTWEGGLRGRYGKDFVWSAGLFNATNYDDIQFLSAGTLGSGYFKNVGETRRRGLEASFSATAKKLNYGANYTYLNAEFRTPMTLQGNNNSSGTLTDVDSYTTGGTTYYYPANSQISVKKGDNIPLIPENILKGFADYEFNEKFHLGGDMILVSGSYVRGNENNQHQAGTVNWNSTSPSCNSIQTDVATSGGSSNACTSPYNSSTYRGPGKIAGYATFNMFASYDVTSEWKIFGRINNVFDKQYATAGALGADPFNSSGVIDKNGLSKSTTVGDTFVAPGAPRSAWIGVRWEFGGVKKSNND